MLLSFALAFADPVVPISGWMADVNGVPMDGSRVVTFRVFDAASGGSPLWSETTTVLLTSGSFQHALGSATPIPDSVFTSNADRWFEAQFGTSTPSERVVVGWAPRARYAATAGDAASLGGVPASGWTRDDESVSWTRLSGVPAGFTDGVDADTTYLPGTGLTLDGTTFAVDFPFTDGRYARLQSGTPVAQTGSLAITGSLAAAGLTSTGDITATGAARFVGDGSGLTNVDAATIAGQTLASLDLRYAAAGASTVPTPPVCNGLNQALGWNGTTWVCTDVSRNNGSSGNANGFPAVDPWGWTWDGVPRTARNWGDADSTCTTLGARLPTASEVFRNNATSGSGALGDTAQSQWLWTRTLRETATHITIRLSDGSTSANVDTGALAYRCVWPDFTSTAFNGDFCMGPAGASCFAKSSIYNMDRQDRPAMPLWSAIDECAFYGARVPELRELEEAVRQGLPNGSGRIWSEERYVGGNSGPPMITYQWTGTATGFTPPNSWASPGYGGNWPTDFMPFRCIGAGNRTGLTAATGTGFEHPTLKFKMQSTETIAASYWVSLDACRAGGGFMPDLAEMEIAIRAGLSGTNNRTWTGEHYVGGNSGPPIVTVAWNGTQTGWYPPNAFGTGYGGNWQSDANLRYRCATYPTLTMPDPTCNGGCFKMTNGNLTYWADNTDRTGTYWQGLDACQAAGGYMPDLVEMQTLVRSGLPNGSGNAVYTSEKYNASNPGPPQITIMWTGTNTAWAAPSAFGSTNAHGGNWPTDSLRYRCVWTNAVR